MRGKVKYKKVPRSQFIQLIMHDVIHKWLNDKDGAVIKFSDIWNICELAAKEISKEGHLKTKYILVKDQPIEKTLKDADRLIKQFTKNK